MKNVLIIADRYYPVSDKAAGGNEALVLTFIECLTPMFNLHVSGPKDSDDLVMGIKLHKWSLPSKSGLTGRVSYKPVVAEIDSYCKENNIELILCIATTSTIYLPLADRYKLVTYCTETPIYGMYSIELGKSYIKLKERGGLVVATSEFIKNEFNKAVPGCIDNSMLMATAPQIPLTINDINRKVSSVIAVSRLVSNKNPSIIVKSMIAQTRFQEKIMIGSPPTNPPKQVDYYNTFKDSLSLVTHFPLLKRSEVLEKMGRAQLLLEGERSQCGNFVPCEAAMQGCLILKLGTEESGFKHIFKEIDPENKFYKEIDVYRATEAKSVSRLLEYIKDFDITPEKQLEFANKTREFFSIDRWKERFIKSIENYFTI